MSIYVINKHIVVLLESKASQEHREKHPRARRRYVVSCTCSARPRADGHCIHTRALLEEHIRPERWKDITAAPMNAPDAPKASPNYGRKALA